MRVLGLLHSQFIRDSNGQYSNNRLRNPIPQQPHFYLINLECYDHYNIQSVPAMAETPSTALHFPPPSTTSLQNPLYQYLSALTQLPKFTHYKDFLVVKGEMKLESMRKYALWNYPRFSKDRWPDPCKFVLLNLVLNQCENRGIKIRQHSIEQKIWDEIAGLLSTEAFKVIKKWISLLKCSGAPKWTEQEDMILEEEIEKTEKQRILNKKAQKSWLQITLRIYQEADAHNLRNQKSAETRMRQLQQLKHPANTSSWTIQEDVCIYILLQANQYGFTHATHVLRDRSYSQIHNRCDALKKRKEWSPDFYNKLIEMMALLARMSKECEQEPFTKPTRNLLEAGENSFVSSGRMEVRPVDG